AATKEQIDEHFQLPKEAEPLLQRVRAMVDTRRGEEGSAIASRKALLDEIYRRPDDDEPRQRYADLLRESGDPRGEFIALQLSRYRGDTDPGRKKRERELLRDHRDRFLGPVAKWVKGVEFKRGFLSACTLFADSRTKAETLAAPEWR